jgi:hypothetical protein
MNFNGIKVWSIALNQRFATNIFCTVQASVFAILAPDNSIRHFSNRVRNPLRIISPFFKQGIRKGISINQSHFHTDLPSFIVASTVIFAITATLLFRFLLFQQGKGIPHHWFSAIHRAVTAFYSVSAVVALPMPKANIYCFDNLLPFHSLHPLSAMRADNNRITLTFVFLLFQHGKGIADNSSFIAILYAICPDIIIAFPAIVSRIISETDCRI